MRRVNDAVRDCTKLGALRRLQGAADLHRSGLLLGLSVIEVSLTKRMACRAIHSDGAR